MRDDTRLRLAWILAITVDALQIGTFLPTLGLSSMANNLLDLALMGTLTALLGWSWAFLPSFAMELVPFLEFAPTWTLAVAHVARKRRRLTPGPTDPFRS